jgi:hypothetical protein
MVRVEHRTDGKRFDTALPLFDETYQGSDWTDCMAARFAVEHAQDIPPASRVDRGYSWALRLVYSTGEVYRYDVPVWQSGNQTVWLYTFGDDIDEVVEWARTVQRDTATGVARGEDP